MKNRNSTIALIAGVLFGGLAFFLLYRNASEIEAKATPVQILIAADYIPAGVFLKANMVEKKAVPESFVSPSAIHELQEVDGLSTLVPISAGEQILSNKFGSGEETLALTLNPGFRAYTVEVNETSGVGNLIRPGNHVDILTKLDSDKREITSFAFQNLQVLAVGQKLTFNQAAQKNQDSNLDDNNAGYSTVTLAVTPEQAETLMYLEGHPLRLVLRGPNDDEIVSVAAQSESEVLSKLGHFEPSAHHGIEIIRGGSKQGE
jgi:pilus assembly protein CpaB